MKKMIQAALLIGSVLGATLTATTVPAAAKSKSTGSFAIFSTRNNYVTTSGKAALVTNQAVAAYPAVGNTPDYTSTLTLAKNTPLTVVKKVGDGAIVTTPQQGTQHFYVGHPSKYVYSNQVTHLKAAQYRHLVKVSKTWAYRLSKPKLHAIQDYTDNGYKRINGYLRTGKGTAKTKHETHLVKTGLATFKLPYHVTFYRGVSKDALKASLQGKALKVGAQYQDKAFSSTSLTEAIALGFTSQCILRINVPAGQTGAYIDPISENHGEKEYLLQSGQHLIVTKVQKVNYTQVDKTYKLSGKGASLKAKLSNTEKGKGSYQLITLNLEK